MRSSPHRGCVSNNNGGGHGRRYAARTGVIDARGAAVPLLLYAAHQLLHAPMPTRLRLYVLTRPSSQIWCSGKVISKVTPLRHSQLQVWLNAHQVDNEVWPLQYICALSCDRTADESQAMDVDGDADLQQALMLSMQVSQCIAAASNAHLVNTGFHPISSILTVQDHGGQDEPAPPPDTEMLTDDAVPNAHQPSTAATNILAQQGPQAQQPSAAANIQSNIFAAALAQAMAALPQQQGEYWYCSTIVGLSKLVYFDTMLTHQ